MNITLSKGGKGERVENLETLVIHDLWGAAQRHPSKLDREYILEVWHLANDLKRELIESDRRNADLLQEIKRTNDFALELMERAARIDRMLADAKGTDLECELGELVRLRQQLGRNRAVIAKAEVQL